MVRDDTVTHHKTQRLDAARPIGWAGRAMAERMGSAIALGLSRLASHAWPLTPGLSRLAFHPGLMPRSSRTALFFASARFNAGRSPRRSAYAVKSGVGSIIFTMSM
jgi:hypothetical protein